MTAVVMVAALLALGLLVLWLHSRPSALSRYVREFHHTYGAPIREIPTGFIPEGAMRLALIREETEEYAEALVADDVVAIADALGDLAYVVAGAALTHGIDLDPVLAEIHRSNMSKLGADGQPLYRYDGKVLKGPHYFKPDLARVLRNQGGAA